MARTQLRPRQWSQRDRQQLHQIMNRTLPPLPTVVGRRPIHSRGIGVKRLPPRSQDKKWKIK